MNITNEMKIHTLSYLDKLSRLISEPTEKQIYTLKQVLNRIDKFKKEINLEPHVMTAENAATLMSVGN